MTTINYSTIINHVHVYYIGMTYPEKALKRELWSIVKSSKPSQVRYVIDENAAKHGNTNYITCMNIKFTCRS